MIVWSHEAKDYLRVDSTYDDTLIDALLSSAEALCMDVARLSPDDWEAIGNYNTKDGLSIRDEEKSHNEVLQIKSLLRVAILYTIGYLYEHREEADHHDLVLTLRNLLFAVREGVL